MIVCCVIWVLYGLKFDLVRNDGSMVMVCWVVLVIDGCVGSIVLLKLSVLVVS